MPKPIGTAAFLRLSAKRHLRLSAERHDLIESSLAMLFQQFDRSNESGEPTRTARPIGLAAARERSL